MVTPGRQYISILTFIKWHLISKKMRAGWHAWCRSGVWFSYIPALPSPDGDDKTGGWRWGEKHFNERRKAGWRRLEYCFSLITVCGAKLVIFRVTAKQLVSYLLPGVAAGAALVRLSGSYYCAEKFVMHWYSIIYVYFLRLFCGFLYWKVVQKKLKVVYYIYITYW